VVHVKEIPNSKFDAVAICTHVYLLLVINFNSLFIFFYFLVIVPDKEKAEKVKQSLPPGLNVKEIKPKGKST